MLRHILSCDPPKVYSQSAQSLLPANLSRRALPTSAPCCSTGRPVPSLTLDPLTKGRHAVRRDEGQLRALIGALQLPQNQWFFPWPDYALERLNASSLHPHFTHPLGKVASCFFDPLYLKLAMQAYAPRPSGIEYLPLPSPIWLTPACAYVSTPPSHDQRSSESRPR
jgi:hypothetical protein